MRLSSELVSQFAEITNDNDKKKTESTVYGVVVNFNDKNYVKIDGSDILTPISTTTNISPGERVTVMIKNHTATVTGNITSPSVSNSDIENVNETVSRFEVIVSDAVTTEELDVERARIDSLVADNVIIKEALNVSTGEFDDLTANYAQINEKLEANAAEITELKTDKLDATVANATYATITNLEATNADLNNLESTYGQFEMLTTNKFNAVDAKFTNLASTYATISQLEVEKGRIANLEAEVADIDTLIFGSASGNMIQSTFSNAVIAEVDEAQIKSAMIESVAADKITSGNIYTNNVQVLSEDGKLHIQDETIQISDANRVRVQIGRDMYGDYSINVWDQNGALMFSKGGITEDAIKTAIIRDDMVTDDADISAYKLNIDSLFSAINGSANTIKSTHIYLDDEEQTLDVAFKTLSDEVTELGTKTTTQGTQITTMQGQMATKIWQQDIDTATNEMSTQYSTLEQNLNSVSSTVASNTSEIGKKADSSTVTTVSNKVTNLEQNLEGFKSTVNNTYATKQQLSNIDIGGRNLLLNTNSNENVVLSGGAAISINGVDSVSNVDEVMTLNCSRSSNLEIYYRFMTPTTTSLFSLEPGNDYTLSGKAQVTTTSGTLVGVSVRSQTNPGPGWSGGASKDITLTDTTDWVYFSSTFNVPANAKGAYTSIQVYFTDSWVGTVKLKELKLEKGNLATDYSPAIEDMASLNQIKDVETSIIQNAEAIELRVKKTELTEAINSISLGGRNLLRNTKSQTGSNIVGNSSILEEKYKELAIRYHDFSNASTGYYDMLTYKNIKIDELGSVYTLSFYAKGSGNLDTYFYGPTGYIKTVKSVQSTGVVRTNTSDGTSRWDQLTDNWKRYWVTWTLDTTGDLSIEKWILFRIWYGAEVSICGVKLEKGNKSTDWTEAPEDIDTRVDTAETKITQNSNSITAVANRTTNNESSIAELELTAEGLSVEVDNAAKTATNYLNFSNNGLVVGDHTKDTLGKNVLIDNDSVDIRNGETVLASFGATSLTLGQNAEDSVIDLCDGAGTISTIIAESTTSYPHYDGIAIESQRIDLKGKRVGLETSYTNSTSEQTSSATVMSGNSGIGSKYVITGSGDKNQTGVSSAATSNSVSTNTYIYSEHFDAANNTWTSNHVSVYPTRTQFSKPISINGHTVTGVNKVLWSGGYYMTEGHTCTLSEGVNDQTNGIVLVFSEYYDGSTSNTAFHTRFVPKSTVVSHNGSGHCFQLSTSNLAYFATKYLYISNTKISGHANNDLTGASTCGITRTNNRFVLRYVIGV